MYGSRSQQRAAAAAGALVVLVIGAALAGATASHRDGNEALAPRQASRDTADDDGPPPSPSPPLSAGPDLPATASTVNVIVVAVAAALVVALVVAGLRRNQITLDSELVDVGPGDRLDVVAASDAVLDDEPVVLASGVAAAILAEITSDLRSEADPARAVRYAYARAEQRLAARGLPRRRAESEQEYLGRVLAGWGDGGLALTELTALFEKARFSTAPVPETMRSAALDALDQLRARLEPAS